MDSCAGRAHKHEEVHDAVHRALNRVKTKQTKSIRQKSDCHFDNTIIIGVEEVIGLPSARNRSTFCSLGADGGCPSGSPWLPTSLV